ncbi:MAG: mechanosensitive ion channel [Candidatus Accumulibacter sp.]|uniref:mechanosensitive ion channel domain-containing protein n=1 Tax=Accumulibacter sp. TaxID=2053492 RepID=UPI001A41C4AE|nr:mechanosensitive ion channel domain-containing protein [Accumulibacter sp.]MBL8396507.1 mechanosensitive ion channel [Accumulibacter sp.]
MIAWRALLPLIALLLGSPVDAQLPLPKTGSKPPVAATPAEPVDLRARAEEQLAEARRRQDAGRTQEAAASEGQALAVSDRQRLLDRLVIAYSEQLKLLDEVESIARSRPEDTRKQVLAADFAGPPPYSAMRVDVLRDEHDATRQRLQRLTSTERALETMKLGRIDEQRRASEAVRLAEDRLARARGKEEIDKERQNGEVAALRRQLAEAELATLGLGLDRVAVERKGLQTFNAEIESVLARVLPEQWLSKEELEQQQAALRRELGKLTAESDTITAANVRRLAERERLARQVARIGNSAADARRLQVLDARLETERVRLMNLSWLQVVIQAASDAWAQRYVGLHSADATTRQEVIGWLSRTRDELAGRQQIIDELQRAARVEAKEQELRRDGSALDADAAARNAELLATLNERVLAYERVDRLSTRLQRQVERWLEDFGFQGRSASSADWKLAALQLGEALKGLWNFEMFVVEDSTIIEGKAVTVSHGVTVGKSIGGLLLFALGYGLFAVLSRRLQRVMVQRFHVDEQMASVMRRWAMIALGILLVIFILNLARIPLTVFAFMGGALAIGIGFGTQTIIKNVISGIIILFERKIRVGDIIALGGTTGHVVAVDLRASTVRGFDGVEALVPNSSFLENQVVNWTYSNPRIRREVRVGIAYGAPVHQAAEIITGCATDHGQVLKNPPPEVFFEDFGDSSLLMVLVYWVELGANLVARRVDSDLRHAIEKRLAAAGIAIPFPQRDVRLDTSQPLAVRLTPAAEG